MAEAGLISFQIAEIVDSIAIVIGFFTVAAITWVFFR